MRFLRTILALLLLPLTALAETPTQVEFAIGGLTDSSGNPLAGGKVYTYACGTTTNKTTWQDGNKFASHANPVVLDAEGKKLIFADGCYKFRIDNSSDVTQYTLDNLRFGLYNGGTTYAGTTTGAGSAYVASLSPPLLALINGAEIVFEANHTNTTAATLNVNSLGAIDLNRADDTVFVAGEIRAGTTYLARYESSTNAWLVQKAIPEFTYYGLTTGSANAYVLTLAPALPALQNGQRITFEASFTNTGAATLNVNSLGAIDLVTSGDVALTANQVVSGYTYSAVYESSTNAWVLLTTTTAAGTYTPTFTNVTNVAASTPSTCGYFRVWNLVSVGCALDVDPTAAAPTATELGISLPIASNLGSGDAWGTCAASASTTERAAAVTADAANDRAAMRWATADTANHTMYCTFSYLVN